MKKRNLLTIAVLMSILHNNSCFSANHEPVESILQDGIYTDFINSDRKSIILNERYNNKNAIYTFKKGASIAIEPNNSSEYYYIFNPISNSTSNSLTINVGGGLDENEQRYKFYLKPYYQNSLGDPAAGIFIDGQSLYNVINLTNTNMDIDLGNKVRNGIMVADESAYGGVNGESILNINAVESDINIFNNNGNEYSKNGVYTGVGGKLTIIGNGESDLNITGNIIYGIRTSGAGIANESTSLEIQGINDLNIYLDETTSLFRYGIYTENEKVNIDLTGNVNIGSASEQGFLASGINITESDRNNVDFDLHVKGNIIIKDTLTGLQSVASKYISGGNKGTNDIDVSANGILINAEKRDNIAYSGVGILISDGQNSDRYSYFDLNTTGENGINIAAERVGYLIEGEVQSNLTAKNGSINITSENQGLRLYSNAIKEDTYLKTSLQADQDITIYGKNEGIESVVTAGKLDLTTAKGAINIISDHDALKLGHYLDRDVTGGNISMCLGEAKGEILTNVTADKTVLISGGDTGIKYATINSGIANITSKSENVYVFGSDNGIYIDSKAIDEESWYKDAGNIAKHNINVKSENGSIYVGDFEISGKNESNGILNSGRSDLDIEANQLVVIQGSNVGLNMQKETNNSIKGKNVVINSYGTGVKSEGVNNVSIGYEESDNKVSDAVIISGDIGLDITANNLGKDDIKFFSSSIDYSDKRIDAGSNIMNIAAKNIEVNSTNIGLNISQAATARNADDNAIIYEVWKNNEINIKADGQMNIIAQDGTAINIEGINDVNIKNTGNNLISGGINGINLSLISNLVQENIDYQKQVDEYIAQKIEDKIKEDYSITDDRWNESNKEIVIQEFEANYSKPLGYNSFADFYNDLFINEELQKEVGVTDEILNQMNPNGDPIKEFFLVLNPELNEEYIDDMFAKTYGEYTKEYILKNNGCETVKEYFDKLVTSGDLISINTNINVRDNFVLETESTNIVLGGAKAFNIDGKLTAFVKGNVNYFKSINFRDYDNFENADYISNAVNVSKDAHFTAQGYANVFEAGRIDEHGFGNETALSVISNSTANIIADQGGNRLSGAVFANSGSVNIESINGGNNFIYSSTHGKDKSSESTSGIHVVSAIYGTDGSQININAGGKGINYISSKMNINDEHGNDREITIWAEQGALVDIDGAVNITASNSGKYINGEKGNAVGIAVSAGGRNLEYDSNGTLKLINNISKVDINYGSDDKNVDEKYIDSIINGDIVAGYGGAVDIKANINTRTENGNCLIVKGNILSANKGNAFVDFGNGGYWEGRADDYYDADKKDDVDFFNPAFSNKITESGKVDMKMQNGFWNVTGQSWLTSFEGYGNTIDMVNYSTSEERNTTHSVTIQNMNGENNKFIMALDNENRNNSDMLYIKDGNATINVEVTGTINGLETVSKENGLRFATVGEGINLDGFANNSGGNTYIRATDGGFYNTKLFVERQDYEKNNQYNDQFNDGDDLSENKPGTGSVEELFGDDIESNADNLVIVRVDEDEISSGGQTILDLSKVNYSNAVYMDRFNKRMGEFRFIDGDDGIWIRLRHDRIGKENAFHSMNTMYEIGYDAKQEKEDGEHRIGFAIDYMDGSSDFSQVNGTGEVSRKGLWMYDSWVGKQGHYRDFVAKWGHLSNDFEFMSGAGEAKGDFSNNVYSISTEFGKKNDIGKNWYFEPQVQIQYAHVTSAEYNMTMEGIDQIQVRNDEFDSLIARAGFRLGKDINDRNTIYFKGDVMHEFLGDQNVYAKDGTTGGKWANVRHDNSGTWYDIGFGFATKINKTSYAYLDLETSFGNDFEESYQINAGLQWSF